MNLVISAVIWAVIIGLMSVDWAELGKLILIGGVIVGLVYLIFSLISDSTVPTKQTNKGGYWCGVPEEAFEVELGPEDLVIEKGLVIDEPWIGEILSGEKTWEMRSTKTSKRGLIALIKKGTKTIVGIAELYECEGPLSLEELKESQSKHRIPDTKLEDCGYKWRVAWKLKNIRNLERPVPYKHKSGATVWVTLDECSKKQLSQSLQM